MKRCRSGRLTRRQVTGVQPDAQDDVLRAEFQERRIGGSRMLASPFGPRFRLRRNHALQARFRHTASIADAKGGGSHFANAPQRQGFRGAGLSRHHTDASEDRAAALECGELTSTGRETPSVRISRGHRGGGARRTFGSVVRGSCRDAAETGSHVHSSRPRPRIGRGGEDQGGGASASGAGTVSVLEP